MWCHGTDTSSFGKCQKLYHCQSELAGRSPYMLHFSHPGGTAHGEVLLLLLLSQALDKANHRRGQQWSSMSAKSEGSNQNCCTENMVRSWVIGVQCHH